MFRDLPPRFAKRLRVALVILYVFAGLAGLSALVFTPVTIAGTIGAPLTWAWGLSAFVSSGFSIYGVVRNRYRVEWRASWPLSASLFMYTLTVFFLVLDGGVTRMAQMFCLAVATGFVSYRGLELAAHAAKLRGDHRARARTNRRR